MTPQLQRTPLATWIPESAEEATAALASHLTELGLPVTRSDAGDVQSGTGPHLVVEVGTGWDEKADPVRAAHLLALLATFNQGRSTWPAQLVVAEGEGPGELVVQSARNGYRDSVARSQVEVWALSVWLGRRAQEQTQR